MKKIVSIMLVMLVSMTALAGKEKIRDPYHFVVEGSFLSSKNVSYTVFKENKEGTFVCIERTKAHKVYRVECNTNGRYIVRFQNKKGDVKFLMIDASTYGYFQADVDWNKPYDGLIKKEKIGYCLVALTSGNRPALLAQN